MLSNCDHYYYLYCCYYYRSRQCTEQTQRRIQYKCRAARQPESEIHRASWNKQVSLLTSRAGTSVCSVPRFCVSWGGRAAKAGRCVTAWEAHTSTSANPPRITAEAQKQLFQRVCVLKILFFFIWSCINSILSYTHLLLICVKMQLLF